MDDNRKVVIELQNVKRYFQVGSETVKAIRIRKVDAAQPVGLSRHPYQWRVLPGRHQRALNVED